MIIYILLRLWYTKSVQKKSSNADWNTRRLQLQVYLDIELTFVFKVNVFFVYLKRPFMFFNRFQVEATLT